LGVVDLPALPDVNAPRTLVTVMHVNNETGTIQPLTKIRELVPEAYFHSDAVQSFGKIPVDVQELGVDFMSFSAHKIHGPKGIGAMFIRKGIDFKAHQQGGGQERNRRAGTEAVALIVGFQVAARLAVGEMEERSKIMRERTDLAIRLLMEQIPDIRLNTPTEDRAPHIVNVSFLDAERLDGEGILQAMDMRGVAVSNGSACVSGSLQPSHVLQAMGRSDAEAKAAVRFSVSHLTTEEEIREAVTILSDVCRNMRVTTQN
jgi:cysteine desulfurase